MRVCVVAIPVWSTEAVPVVQPAPEIRTVMVSSLEALKNDDVIRSAMPGEMYRLYDEYKRDEWERFLHTVTDWDVETYLDCLP